MRHPNLRTAVRLLHSWTGGLRRSPAICWRRVDFIGIAKASAFANFELSGVRNRGHGRGLLAGIFLRLRFVEGKTGLTMAPLFQRLFVVEPEAERLKAAPEVDGAAPAQEATTDGAAQAVKTQEITVQTELAHAESPQGLIPASNLPPAADALAELFAENSSREEAQGDKVVRPPVISEMKPAEPKTEGAPKRRGIFARLLTFKRPTAKSPETVSPAAETSNVESAGEEVGAAAAQVVAAAETRELGHVVTTDSAPAQEAAEGPIRADKLPSATDALANLFPPEETSAVTTAHTPAEAREELREALPVAETSRVLSQVPVEAFVEAASQAFAKSKFEERAPTATISSYEPPRIDASLAFSADTRYEIPTDETIVENEHRAGQLSSLEAQWRRESLETAAEETKKSEDASDSSEEESSIANELSDLQEILSQPRATVTETPRRLYKDWEFDEKLASHREWVESHGKTGQRADLSNAQMEATELISVNLRMADLHDANLRATDLLLADLRDACMVRADLEEACVVGANLEGANLEGASLETAMGLVPRQFAGANLRDALLSPELMEFQAVAAFQRESRNAFRYFGLMTAGSVLSWLVIWKTRDVQLLTDSAVIPFLHSHAAATAVPTAESYLIVPVVIFIVYLLFHFHLQRLWDAVMELPAIFPDGQTLGDSGPGIITGLLRTHFRWMNPDPTSTRLVEKGLSLLAAYWIVPATLLLFWARYLTRQEIHGTILHALLLVIATGVAAYATTKVGRPQERWAVEKKWTQRVVTRLKAINPISVAAVAGVVLMLLSVGIIAGVPHDRTRAPQYGATNIRRWAANAFWWLAFDPYADLTEASISRRPADWNGADDQVASVDGLRANNAKFRYAQAYGAFLANSHLWRADFQGAFLSEADLRGADLGQSNMRFAVMDHALMSHANLDRSNLDGADMRRADLRGANLSYCSLADAVLVDARLDGASFYTARLDGATMTRANLEKADFRESYLGGAHLDHVDLKDAYLWSAKLPGADLGGAQLEGAILIDADVQGANLGGAQLTGTVLNGADLSGTSLEGADLRGALGLSANQVCTAKSRRGAMLDAEMQTQVEALCGKR